MNKLITRRKLITAGLGVAAGTSGIALAARLANRYGLIPPDSGGVFGVGETLTYAAQRMLMHNHPLAREFNRSEISKVAPVNGDPPKTEVYDRLLHNNFADWRLTVDGLVARHRFPSKNSSDCRPRHRSHFMHVRWVGRSLLSGQEFRSTIS